MRTGQRLGFGCVRAEGGRGQRDGVSLAPSVLLGTMGGLLVVGAAACGPTDEIPAIVDEPATAVVLPEPGFHHLHINAVNPTASLDWWQTVWPVGEATEVAGFPAFVADGVYHLYTQVDTSWTMWG